MTKAKKENKKRYISKKSTFAELIPILFTLAVVPLIIFAYTDKTSQVEALNFSGDNVFIDIFNYYKSVGVILAAIAAIGVYFIKYLKDGFEIKKSRFYLPTAIYAGFIVLSSLTSEYREIAISGFAERYEGMILLLCYLVLLVITYNFVNTDKHINYITVALAISSSIICLIGIAQFIGYNFFGSYFAKQFLYGGLGGQEVSFPFGKYAVFSTLSNSNYVGSFVALVLPLFLFTIFRASRVRTKIGLATLVAALICILIGSKSRAGLVGCAIIAVLLIAIFRREIWNKKVIFIGLVSLCVIGIFAVNIVTNGMLSNKVVEVLKLDKEQRGVTFDLSDIILENNECKIVAGDETLYLKIENSTLLLYDKNNQPIEIEIHNGENTTKNISIKNDKYKDYVLSIVDSTLEVKNKDASFSFLMTNAGFMILGEGKKATKEIGHPESFGFKNMETLGSARGYLWSRTIPMLKDTIIKGYGPDTYAIKFPQNDYVGKIRAYGVSNISVTKPHNLYLQIGVNTGVLSLIAVLVLFGIYIVECIRLYCRKQFDKQKLSHITGAGIFVGVCGYLAAGLFNDSVVPVAPVFWVLLGVGFACNYLVRNEKAG